MMYNNNRDARDGDSGGAEKEIATRTVQVQSKRFYLDVKQNRRGRFLKIAEVGASGQKSRVLMSMSATTEFREKLDELVKHYKQSCETPTTSAAAAPADGDSSVAPSVVADAAASPGAAAGGASTFKFRSETLSRENRRYFLDLKENQRGKFLRIAQQVSPSGMRSQIAMPAQGIEELRDRLVELIAECGTEDLAEGVEQLPPPKSIRVDNKMFYFDIGANRRGMFLRLSEVRANFRTAVTIPEKSWAAVRDTLDEYIAKVADKGEVEGDEDDEAAEEGDAEAAAAGKEKDDSGDGDK